MNWSIIFVISDDVLVKSSNESGSLAVKVSCALICGKYFGNEICVLYVVSQVDKGKQFSGMRPFPATYDPQARLKNSYLLLSALPVYSNGLKSFIAEKLYEKYSFNPLTEFCSVHFCQF